MHVARRGLLAAWILRHMFGFRLAEVAVRRGWSLATTKRRLVEADEPFVSSLCAPPS